MSNSYIITKRALDVLVSTMALLILAPVMFVVAIIVRISSRGPVLYWSNRVGRGGKVFWMPKFRTMKVGTPAVATHLMVDASSALTPVGGILRRTSLDELPQLWSVLTGEMSLVGPRPALFNQEDLIALREAAGVNDLAPGITGWAQINGRDELTIKNKVALDQDYMARASLGFDLFIMFQTIKKMFNDKTIAH